MNQFKPLPYKYDALEPFIDQQTMQVHHDKHYKAYFDKFTDAIKKYDHLRNKDVTEILSFLKHVPEKILTSVVNNGGGYFHHRFFWEILKKNVPFKGKGTNKEKWKEYQLFKEEFSNAALSVFGSGWTWLVVNKQGNLEIINTKDQESPLSSGKKPILGIDVWEHAYYLKYQNRRAEYVENFFNVINWDKVNELYLEIKKKGDV